MKDEQIFKSNDRRRIGCYNQLAVQCQQVAEKFLKGYLDNLFVEEDVTDLLRFLYKGIIINHNKKPSQPTLKRRFFKKKAAFFSWPGLGKEWC